MDSFNATVDKLLFVSHEALQRRMNAYKKHASKNPNKRDRSPNPNPQ
jgi:hypothetical protein